MKVVILCGGRGTRLKEETEFKPKPLVEVGGKPILWHIMKIYSHYGHNDFILALGYKGDMIKHYFVNYEWMSSDFTLSLNTDKRIILHNKERIPKWNITFADTGLNTKTAGRLKLVEKYIPDDTFMLTYGDGVADINIKALLEFHEKKGKIATITGLHPFSKYGVIKVKDGLVEDFKEKPVLNDLINGGFMVFNREIFDRIDLKNDCMLVEKTLPELAKEGQLALYKHDGFWHCMDTYKDYLDLNAMWNSGKAPWVIWDMGQGGINKEA